MIREGRSDPQELIIHVPLAYAGRKTAHHWPDGGMTPVGREEWRRALEQAVLQHGPRLRAWVANRTPLEARVRIFGPKRRIDPLDVHDALAQILDDLTAVAFPRAAGRPIPQWQDKFYWRVSAEKLLAEVGRVEIEIEPIGMEPGSGMSPGAQAHQADRAAEVAFHQDLLASGLVRDIKHPAPRPDSERPLVTIQGQPLSETIIEDRR